MQPYNQLAKPRTSALHLPTTNTLPLCVLSDVGVVLVPGKVGATLGSTLRVVVWIVSSADAVGRGEGRGEGRGVWGWEGGGELGGGFVTALASTKSEEMGTRSISVGVGVGKTSAVGTAELGEGKSADVLATGIEVGAVTKGGVGSTRDVGSMRDAGSRGDVGSRGGVEVAVTAAGEGGSKREGKKR